MISKLSSYSTIDFSMLYTIKNSKYFSEIVITAMLNNIFNKEYVSNGYYYTYDDTWSDPNIITTIEGTGYYPQAKRNFLLGFTFKL
jgi:iron complex outermembrane receptor protein